MRSRAINAADSIRPRVYFAFLSAQPDTKCQFIFILSHTAVVARRRCRCRARVKWPARRRLRARSYYRAIATQIIRLSIPINIPRARDKAPLVIYMYIFFIRRIFFTARSRPRGKDLPRQFSQTRRRALSRARIIHPCVYYTFYLCEFSLSPPSSCSFFFLFPKPTRRSAPNVFYAKRSHFRNAPRPGSRLSRSRNIHVNNFRRCVFSSFFSRVRFSLRRKLQLRRTRAECINR